MKRFCTIVCISLAVGPVFLHAADPAKKDAEPETISYYKHIRPLFAQHCQGCHQPAIPKGKYVMTDFAAMMKPGEMGMPSIVPGKPDESRLLEQIVPQADNKAKMPKGKDPLLPRDIQLIKKWIAQGAKDDTPPSAKGAIVDAAHPPAYTLPPVITSIDFSPDGHLLAVAGYHEILIHKADGSGLLARLVGLSERIQSVAFSPDGKALAATGGSPGRFGEVQIWDLKRKSIDRSVATDAAMRAALLRSSWANLTSLLGPQLRDTGFKGLPGLGEILTGELEGFKLRHSISVTFDTVYGASWSHDGTRVAFGCADNTVRVIEAATGKQVLFSGAHSDWVLDTTWSRDDQHVISVSRDRAMKCTEFATQRFIDNVTSITPGALKGGLMTVAIRPSKEMKMVPPSPDNVDKRLKLYDELLTAGADGLPRLYRLHRNTKRVIGDDANKLRQFDPLPGRIYTADFSADGEQFVVGSSLDGKGEVRIYQTSDAKKLATLEGQKGPVYSAIFHPNGKVVASAGFDGSVRLNDAASGKLIKEFVPVPVTPGSSVATGSK